MRLTARQKAEYITTQLIAFAKSQSFIVHDAQMNGMNKDLIDNLNWNGASVKRYNAYQTHKQLTLSRNDFESFINSFKFSEEDTMNKDYAIALLNRLKAENVDMWYMRYETGEHRSTSDYRVNALLQGRSEGKVVTDPDYYVGDRYIKTDNLSVQIHRVFLKNDIEDQYTKGDEVYMLAFILPDNYVGGSAARRMTTDEIRNRL